MNQGPADLSLVEPWDHSILVVVEFLPSSVSPSNVRYRLLSRLFGFFAFSVSVATKRSNPNEKRKILQDSFRFVTENHLRIAFVDSFE